MDQICINDPVPDTASLEPLIAALLAALRDIPGVVVTATADVQSAQQPAAKAA